MVKKERKKRCPSGYNLYIKDCYERSGEKGKEGFSKCLTNKGWSKLSDKEKEKWNEKARDMCDV